MNAPALLSSSKVHNGLSMISVVAHRNDAPATPAIAKPAIANRRLALTPQTVGSGNGHGRHA